MLLARTLKAMDPCKSKSYSICIINSKYKKVLACVSCPFMHAPSFALLDSTVGWFIIDARCELYVPGTAWGGAMVNVVIPFSGTKVSP